jgi:hypothetical protein
MSYSMSTLQDFVDAPVTPVEEPTDAPIDPTQEDLDLENLELVDDDEDLEDFEDEDLEDDTVDRGLSSAEKKKKKAAEKAKKEAKKKADAAKKKAKEDAKNNPKPTPTPVPTPTPGPTPTPVPTPVPGGGGAAGFPSSVLDLANWKITLPCGKAESPDEITQPSLNKFVHSEFFHLNSTSDAVVFKAPVDGVTTSGSSYC